MIEKAFFDSRYDETIARRDGHTRRQQFIRSTYSVANSWATAARRSARRNSCRPQKSTDPGWMRFTFGLSDSGLSPSGGFDFARGSFGR